MPETRNPDSVLAHERNSTDSFMPNTHTNISFDHQARNEPKPRSSNIHLCHTGATCISTSEQAFPCVLASQVSLQVHLLRFGRTSSINVPCEPAHGDSTGRHLQFRVGMPSIPLNHTICHHVNLFKYINQFYEPIASVLRLFQLRAYGSICLSD